MSDGFPVVDELAQGSQVVVAGALPKSVVSVSSPDTGANAAARIAVAHEAPLNVKWPEYGAKGDGVTDDTAAIQAAVNALPTGAYRRGGEILFPDGLYLYTALNLNSTNGVKLHGYQGRDEQAACELRYNGATGATRAIDARSAYGLAIEDLSLSYTGAFTGLLLDYSHVVASDSQLCALRRCRVGFPIYGGIAPQRNSCAALVSLASAIFFRAEDCEFQGAQIGIRGIDPAAITYSNGHVFDTCSFNNLATAGVMNMGQQCSIRAPQIEATNGGLGGIPIFYLDNLAVGQFTYGLEIVDMWAGDGTFAYLIDFGNTTPCGFRLEGGQIGSCTTACVIFRNGCRGAHISGATFGGAAAVDLGALGSTNGAVGVQITGNDFRNVTGALPVLNTAGQRGVTIKDNTGNNALYYSPTQEQLYLAGHIITEQPSWVAPAVTDKWGNLGTTGTVTINGNDTCGQISLTPSGTGIAAGNMINVHWALAYDSAQQHGKVGRMVLTPCNAVSAAIQAFADTASALYTTIGFGVAPTTGVTYTFNYWVAQ